MALPGIPPTQTLISQRNRYIALAIAGYVLFAILWIFLSDQLLAEIIDVEKIRWLSTAKGMLFVLITSLALLYTLYAVPSTLPETRTLESILHTERGQPHRAAWLRYGFAILIATTFVLLRTLIVPETTTPPLFIIFTFPMILAAVFGGLGPGLVATLITTLGIDFLAIDPIGSLRIKHPYDLVQLGSLLCNGILVSILSEILQRSLRQIEAGKQLQAIILASIGDAIIATDTDGKINYLNTEALRLCRCEYQQALGHDLGDIFKLKQSDGDFLSASDMQQLTPENECTLLDPCGNQVPVSIQASPIILADHIPLGTVIVFRDESERKQMNAALQQRNQLLQEMSWVAHIGGWEYDPQTRQMTWTEEVSHILGLTPNDTDHAAQGLEYFQHASRSQIEAALENTLASSTPFDLELEIQTVQDELKWVRIVAAPIFERGVVARIRGAIQDIQTSKQAEAALRNSEARLSRVIEGSEQGFWDWNLQNGQFDISPRFASMLGHTLETLKIQPQDWPRLVHPDDLPKALHSIEQHLQGLTPLHQAEIRCQTRSGEWKWILTRGKIVEYDAGGHPLIMSGTHTDISERKAVETSLRNAATVFENTQEGVVITDTDARIIMVNQAFTRLTGYNATEVIGKNPSLLKSGRHGQDFYQAIWHDLKTTGYWQGEIWNRRKNGEIFPEWQSISTVKDDSGQIMHYVSVFTDISNLKASEAQLDFLAHHDPLTRLPNRLLLFSRLDLALGIARRDGSALALLIFDLDRFKDINDSYGHMLGDQLLQQVAERLSSRLRSTDFLARLGGDEFTLLLENLPRPEDAARVAGELISALNEPFWLNDAIEIRTSASMGISLFPSHGASAESLLQQADAAMYRAKAEGRGRYQYFSEHMTQAARERIQLDNRLRRAIRDNELRIHYQPQIDIRSGRIVGAEALVRWLDPEEGLISPTRFIPIAEETGLIRDIGEWVLHETCRQGREWLDAGLPPLVLAVNVSGHQIRHGNFGEIVEQVLATTHFPSSSLELELTESTLMEDRDDVAALLKKLRARHIRLAIDDFGTGYSSLAYLKRFPLDILKIDKSFVDDIAHDRDDREIAIAIIEMGHTLGFKVLAEGVESAEQLAFLEARGCDMYQGFFRSKPLPADEFVKLLKN